MSGAAATVHPDAPAARYDGIQALRAVAALLVLLAHAYHLAPAPWAWLKPWSPGGGVGGGGAIGVDVFFVVSGFVVAMSAERPGVTARGFLFDRATRVLPLYLVMSLPFLASNALSWRGLWNTLAFLPVFDRGSYTNPAHGFGWSLGLELWFYVVFAAVVRAAPPGRRIELLAASSAVLVGAGWLHTGDWVLPRFVGTPMMLEFVAGAVLHRYRAALGPVAALLLAPAGLALAAVAAAGFPELGSHRRTLTDADLALLRLALWGVPAVLLVAGAVALDRLRFRWPAPLVAVGDWSYSVYLVQPFAIIALKPVNWPDGQTAWAALLVAVLILSYASHRWIERPATDWLRGLAGAAAGDGAAARARA